MNISEVSLLFGSVQFNKGMEETEERREVVDGGVYVTPSTPGSPDFFDVAFNIRYSNSEGGRIAQQSMLVQIPIIGFRIETPYASIEQSAVERISPLLRALADKIDKHLADPS